MGDVPACDPELLKALRRGLLAARIPDMPDHSFAVALSGGADSAMLVVHAAHLARQTGRILHCFHIHHGLQPFADAWQRQAHRLAAILGISCHSVRVEVDLGQGDGMEAAARDARYQALEKLAARVGVNQVWLAHHRDDQAETVLLRLLRGAGPTGLSAMAPASVRDGITYVRPWLELPRTRILAAAEAFARATGWEPVQDPTNLDPAYTRAAVRCRLTPILDERWRGWQGVLSRHARQSRELASLVAEIAAEDWQKIDPADDGLSFSLAAWRMLSDARQAQVLRYWLARQSLRAPTDARLSELMRQMRGLHALGHDRQMKLQHGRAWITCVRGRIMLVPKKQ